ncbi:hypothetical protein GGX14DRAFT_342338, partial [Mycena pura]
MDHLSIPPGASHIRVPYKGTELYDGGDFFSYPGRKKWTEEDLLGLNGFGGRDASEVEAFFQTWLYFGALTCVFKWQGVNVDTAEFLTTDEGSGEVFITTGQVLLAKIRAWRVQWDTTSDKTRKGAGNRTKVETLRILNELCKYTDRYCGVEGREFEGLARAPSDTTVAAWPVSGEISLSTIALGYLLSQAARAIYRDGFIKIRWGASPLLKEGLLERGWCPLDVRRLLTDSAVDGQYYLFMKDCPDDKQRHRGCDESACCATTINEATYVVRHVSGCEPECSHDGVSDDRVSQIIVNNGIPVVSWKQDAGEGCSGFTVQDASASGATYLAISHVWADGLGNPVRNSLPVCQLKRIQACVNAAFPEDDSQPVCFWMDTLCIPVADKYHDVRKKAIGSMRQVYRNAGGVLVFDAKLQKLSRSSTNDEKAVGVYMSNWIHRLWTFQEGMLAKKLFFQLKDGPLYEKDFVDDSVRQQEDEEKSGLYGSFQFTMRSAALGHFTILRDFVEMKLGGNGVYFPPLTHAIQQRTTTRKSDEAICAATILNTDLEEILKIESKHVPDEILAVARMEVFLRQVGEFPQGIIFHQQPRLRRDGYCWAPKTIMGAQPGELARDLNEPRASFDGTGLRVRYPGFLLD